MDRQIAGQMGLGRAANNEEMIALSEHTSIEEVAQAIEEGLPAE